MALTVDHLVKHFAGVHAVRGISFEVQAGECVALIGPNGAGKSTSFACIAGQQQPTQGQLQWNGQVLNGLSAAQRLRLGIARTFQVAQVFEALTVLQNVQLLTQYPRGLEAYNVLERADSQTAQTLLTQVGLEPMAHLPACELAYGAKKRLELAMALAGLQDLSTPRLLLLDEPAAGLAATERAALMALVKSLARPTNGTPGLAVLYTEHNMDAVFGVADRVLVLIDGQLAAQGTPDAIAQNATVLNRYLGQSWRQHA